MKKKVFFTFGILVVAIVIVLIYNIVSGSHRNVSGALNTIKLINIAKDCSIIAEGTGNTNALTDGNSSTWWCTNNSNWPTSLIIALPTKGVILDEIDLKFLQETQFPKRSLDINIDYDLVGGNTLSTGASDFKFFNNDFSFVFPPNSLVNKLKITLSNPKDAGNVGKFWPAIQEIEIYSPKS
ncbi:MAG: hypothetical protein FWC47_03900 [Oscillospiraceae bacterium]|nr:hypothetical protein [Oscillospiraceae bacterium]